MNFILLYLQVISTIIYFASLFIFLIRIFSVRKKINYLLLFIVVASFVLLRQYAYYFNCPTFVIYLVECILLSAFFFITLNCSAWTSLNFALSATFYRLAIEGILVCGTSIIIGTDLLTIISNYKIYSFICILVPLFCIGFVLMWKNLYVEDELKIIFPKVNYTSLIIRVKIELCILILFERLMYTSSLMTPYFHLIIYIITILLLYTLFAYCLKSSSFEKYQIGYFTYENQLKIQLDNYEIQAQYINNLRKFKHDYSNLKFSLNHIIANKNFTQLENFYKEMDDIASIVLDNREEFSNNGLAQAILNNASTVCKLNNTSFKASVFIPDDLDITDFELCRILANMIDNAVEAATSSGENSYINIKEYITNSWFSIICTNTYHGELIVENDKIKTSKTDSLNHGYGMQNMQEIIDKKKGFLKIDIDNNSHQFTLKLHIPYAVK